MQASVQITDGLVLQHGDGIPNLPGCSLVDLTPDQAQQITTVLASNPYGATFTLVSGVLTSVINAGPDPDPNQTDFDNNYDAALARLTDIITNGGAYAGPQVRDAVIDLARIQRRLLRLAKGRLAP